MNSGSVVVDVSFAVPWVIQEAHSAAATAKLAEWETAGTAIRTPALFAAEAASVMRKHSIAGGLTDANAQRALRELLDAVTIVPTDRDLAPRALAIANLLGAGRAYDSLYAALAEREGCEFWTGDKRFYNGAHRRFSWVRWVGEGSVSGQQGARPPKQQAD